MFDPVGHVLLSEEAAALDGPALTARARLAEDLLGLPAATFDLLTSDQQRTWGEAVVLQINYGLEQHESVLHEALADRQVTYRRDRESTSPAARWLVDRHLAGVAGLEAGTRLDFIGEDI